MGEALPHGGMSENPPIRDDAQEFFDEGQLLGVWTTQPLGRRLDYKAPEGGCWIGAFVEVPLGPRKVMGVVWGPGKGDWDYAKTRKVIRVLDVPPMRAELREFLEKAGAYTLTDMESMLRLGVRAPGLGDPPSMRKIYRKGDVEPDRMTEARGRVLDALDEYGDLSFTLKELSETAGVTSSVVKGLVKLGAVSEQDTPRDLPFARLDPSLPGKELAPDQAEAAEQLKARVCSGAYGTTLLRGVTGSGKTEVYLEAVAECLRKGRQALVLLPEIALTAEFLTRVLERFGAKPAEWHSGVTMTERRRTWKMVGQGGAQLVVGARSALFLPFRDLGLIVVDEEHDTSYKQEDGVLYNARDMTVLRASICSAQVILASATPSLESWANAEAGKYTRIDLTSRFGDAVMPDMRAIDMRGVKLAGNRWISPVLKAEVEARVASGEQALLFINRRGYAPVTICRACGHQIGCDHCDARMVEHRFQKRLVCHQCGESKALPEVCPSCEAEDRLAAVGPGVERLAEEAAELFPEARIATLSSDMYGSARALKAEIVGIAEGAADIIIGTQLVAKGHNFPLLTLVGVIDADLGLARIRSARGGADVSIDAPSGGARGTIGQKKGTALMQTYQPEHPVIRAILAGDENAFWTAEAGERRMAGVPPYGRLAGIILSSTDPQEVFDLGGELARLDGPSSNWCAGLWTRTGTCCAGAWPTSRPFVGESRKERTVAARAESVDQAS